MKNINNTNKNKQNAPPKQGVKNNTKNTKNTERVSQGLTSHTKKNEREVKQMSLMVFDADTEEDMVQFFVTQPKSQAEGGRDDF